MKRYAQKRATAEEETFSAFCKRKSIESFQLDKKENEHKRVIFLIDPNGKCPDFWCKKGNKEIFVEVKTIENIVREKTQKLMDEYVKKELNGRSGIIPIEIDPKEEYKGRLESNLRNASKKFKNIKNNYNFPKVLLLNNIIGARFICNSVFMGVYDSYSPKGHIGKRKIENGLFDKTGKSVSAIVFLSKKDGSFDYVANPQAEIEFSDDFF